MKPKVAVIGTGGTLAAVAESPLEMLEYDPDRGLEIDELLARIPELHQVAEVVPVTYWPGDWMTSCPAELMA